MSIGFESSSWMGLWILLFPPASSTSASPTRTSFGSRWTSPRCQPGRYSTSKTPRCSSRSRKVWGFEAFFTRITGPRARNWLRWACRMTSETHMKPANPRILTINGGSSSIKFALYHVEEPLKRGLYGKVDRIGLSGTNLTFNEPTKKKPERHKLAAADHKLAANSLIDWLEKQIDFKSVKGVGHPVVHGMKHTEPEIVTKKLLDELRRISPNDPDHLPREIELIETFRRRHPKLPQVACFDTAFHQTMPRVAKLLPIPRHFDARGIQRYGFHGLSYACLVEELARLGDPAAENGRVILAHLGNGASL